MCTVDDLLAAIGSGDQHGQSRVFRPLQRHSRAVVPENRAVRGRRVCAGGPACFGGSRHTVARSGKRERTHGGGPRKLTVAVPANEAAASKASSNASARLL